MKNIKLLIGLSMLIFSLSACDDDDDKVIDTNELPATSQTFLSTYFPGEKILDTRKDNNEYEVYYTNYKVEFTLDGVWKQVDGKRVSGDYRALPQAFLTTELPVAISNWVAQNYPGVTVIEVEKEYTNATHTGYDIELSNGMDDIDFDLNGNLINGVNPPATNTLPETAQTFLNTYFANDAIVNQKRDDGDYEVILTSGIEIDFNSQGVWKNVDGKFDNGQYRALPEAFLTAELPEAINTFVATNYPGKVIIEVDKEYNNNNHTGFEIDLNGNVELDFDINGNLIGSGGTTVIELPQAAETFLNTHFNGVTYTPVRDENEFDVYVDGYKVEFDMQGNWKQVDGRIIRGNYKAVPESFLMLEPLNLIADYIANQYPNAQIQDVEKEYNNNQHIGYEFTLDNNLELDFNLNGQPVLSGGQGSIVNINNLPQAAQTFINTHFSNVTVRYIKQDDDEYEVYLNGFDLEFDLQGNWTKVDGYVGRVKTQLPASFLTIAPVNTINNYIASNFPGSSIDEIEKDYENGRMYYNVDLDNNLELIFDTQGQFVRRD